MERETRISTYENGSLLVTGDRFRLVEWMDPRT